MGNDWMMGARKVFDEFFPEGIKAGSADSSAPYPYAARPVITLRTWASYQLLLLGLYLQKLARIMATIFFILAVLIGALQVHFLLSHFRLNTHTLFQKNVYLKLAADSGIIMNLVLLALLLAIGFYGLLRWSSSRKRKRDFRQAADIVTECARGNYQLRLPEQGDLAEIGVAVNQLTANLSETVYSLAARDDARRGLIADVSHDLLKPVASIHSYIETIMRKHESLSGEELLEYLSVIQRGTKSMDSLVSDFMILANLDDAVTKPEIEEFSIGDLAHDVYLKCAPLAAKKEILFDITPLKKNLMVNGDIKLMDRVLFNLVENAIQYTQTTGAVGILIEEEENQVLIQICDTGPGISPQEQGRIFDPLYRGKDAASKNSSGHGLGLAITKKIIELHQTQLFLRSKKGKGTTFFFSLPKKKVTGKGCPKLNH